FGQVLLGGERVRMDQRRPGEKECNQRERDGGCQPRIHDMLIELTIHGCAATLQGTSKDDEGDDPSGIRIHKLSLAFSVDRRGFSSGLHCPKLRTELQAWRQFQPSGTSKNSHRASLR